MEVVFLFFSFVSTLFTSSFLSIRLAFLSLLSFPIFPTTNNNKNPSEGHSVGESHLILYQGRVWHQRSHPLLHQFSYNVRYALINLDHVVDVSVDALLRKGNHMSSAQVREIAATSGPVFLLTIPASVGYEQNPLSVYYCYDQEGSDAHLKKCIAQVTNTPWGERVSFVFNPDSDSVAKPLHVSPFMDMLGTWNMQAHAPGENLFLKISVDHPSLGNYFTATLQAKRLSKSLETQIPELFFWLMPQKVAFWIYWQALKLWWKNVPFMQHPKYHNVKYREEALIRDWQLRCGKNIREEKIICRDSKGGDGLDENDSRWCVWNDAEWPWS
ncbi:hypothetical protein AMTRI_Chr02g253840 [Amborella trichopoda]|uniref:DUF1365 domain-containing protein n=1 Tax=Amborella trichopoda TaxID=13333 RepID=W1NX96_AMBTC|nr:uncharacterized protein LOC18427330 [Amborella trichopoda]ERM99299.1 hypothetical protein AMTR_s00092p00170280 [Amborella trichopoda]|eukprot:XP_006836446.1 uncharacterized protein LOC18427330 [Amborella trichopoda]